MLKASGRCANVGSHYNRQRSHKNSITNHHHLTASKAMSQYFSISHHKSVLCPCPFISTAVGRKAFRYAAPTVWNSIPFNIRHSPSIGSFKCHLKRTFSPSPVSHVLHLATPAPPTRSSKLALYKSCNNNNNNNCVSRPNQEYFQE